MALASDKKFVNLVSPKLSQFVWKKGDLANFRCPFCGDSKKSKIKLRGYFFARDNSFFFRCHNCGASHTLYRFLELFAPALCKEYAVETYAERNGGRRTRCVQVTVRKPLFEAKNKILKAIDRLEMLPISHPCVEYVRSRKIPTEAYSYLYYAEDFSDWARRLDPEIGDLGTDPRLVIPIFSPEGKLVAAQGRSLRRDAKLRYITIKADKSVERLWYGLERLGDADPVIVVEGPLDSLFLPGSVAMIGINEAVEIPDSLKGRKLVFALDNEPRNPEVLEQQAAIIRNKHTVCIWPSSIVQKDINDMIKEGGKRPEEIRQTILANSFAGAEANLRFNSWRKVGDRLPSFTNRDRSIL